MAANCGTILDLGCIYCGQATIAVGDTVFPATGTFTAVFQYAGTEVLLQFEGVEGEAMLVPIGNLGSPYTYTFHILDPDEERVTLSSDSDAIEYGCARFQLKTALVGELVPIDLTGLTCEQLNDEDLGLTEDQLLDCILPEYDFSSEDVLEALTDQQEADLTAAFGGGGPCDPATVRNSDSTYSDTVAAGAELVLPDVEHTDSDGAPVTLPALTPFVATPCVAAPPDYYYATAIGHP